MIILKQPAPEGRFSLEIHILDQMLKEAQANTDKVIMEMKNGMEL